MRATMQSSIYLIIAFVAFTSAKQLDLGPQVFSEAQSSSSSSQNQEKRYATQVYTLYLTPDEIKEFQGFESSKNEENVESLKGSQLKKQYEDEQQLKWHNGQDELAAYEAFYQNRQKDLEVQQENYKYGSFYAEEKTKEDTKETSSFPEISKENLKSYYSWQKEQDDKKKQESALKSEDKWKPYLASAKIQDDFELSEQLKQQWNRILERNRGQSKSLSPAPKKFQEVKKSEKKGEKPVGQWSSRSEREKEIQSILRSNKGYQLVKQGKISQAEAIKQSLPILIHKKVSVIKHHPVPIVQKVKVEVPTPVLVPVPEPYEVKIPHPYPVPQQIYKHIPVPVVRKY